MDLTSSKVLKLIDEGVEDETKDLEETATLNTKKMIITIMVRGLTLQIQRKQLLQSCSNLASCSLTGSPSLEHGARCPSAITTQQLIVYLAPVIEPELVPSCWTADQK